MVQNEKSKMYVRFDRRPIVTTYPHRRQACGYECMKSPIVPLLHIN